MAEVDYSTYNDSEIWEFVLYIAGDTIISRNTESRLREACNHYLPGRYRIRVIDIRVNIEAVPPDVLAMPTVARIYPRPEKRVIGNLAEMEKTVEGLGLKEGYLPGCSPPDM